MPMRAATDLRAALYLRAHASRANGRGLLQFAGQGRAARNGVAQIQCLEGGAARGRRPRERAGVWTRARACAWRAGGDGPRDEKTARTTVQAGRAKSAKSGKRSLPAGLFPLPARWTR